MVDDNAIGVPPLVEGSIVQKSSDSITCTSTQDDPSSGFGDLGVNPGKFTVPVRSDQVEEGTEISMPERSDLLSDDCREDTSNVMGRDDEVNVKYFEGREVTNRLSRGKDSSFLDPSMDSLMLMGQECGESAYSKNPDGLLESIAYPVKVLKDMGASERSSKPAKDTCSLVKEGDGSIGTKTVELGDEIVPVLSHPGEDSKDMCFTQPDPGTKDDYNVELPTQSANIIDDHGEEQLDSLIEVTEGEQSPECHLNGNSKTDIGKLSEMVLETHSTVSMDYETQINEVEDENGLDNCKSQIPESAFVEKRFEDEVTENAEKPEVEVNISDAKSNVTHLPAFLSDVDVKITSPIADHLVGKENLVPSACPAVTTANSDGSVFVEKAEDLSSAGQNSDTSVLTGAKLTKDESVTGHALMDVELVSLKADTKIQQSHYDVPNIVDGVVEQDGKCLDSQLPNEPFAITDPVATSGSPLKGELQNVSGMKVACLDHQSQSISSVEQNEEKNTNPPPAELAHSHEKEIMISASVCLSHPEGNLISELSSPCLDHQSQSISGVEEKEEENANPPAAELAHSPVKEIMISASVCLSHPEGNLLSELSSRPVAKPTDDRTSLDSTLEPQPIVDEQSSCYVDSVDGSCHNESQPALDKPISYVCTVGVEVVPPVNYSAPTERDSSDLPTVFTPANMEKTVNVTVGLPSKDEEQTWLDPPPSEKNSSGGAQNYFVDASPLTLSRSNSEANLVEADNSKPTSLEANCGSPTVISCSDHLQHQEGSRVLSDQTGTISSNASLFSFETGGDGEKAQSSAQDLKGSATCEEHRSFTFEVGSLADLSEKDSGSEWKPFPSMQSSVLHKVSEEKSRGSHIESKQGKQSGVKRKMPNADKSRATVPSNESLTTPKGKSTKESSTPMDKDARSCSVSSTSVGTVSRDMKLEERRQFNEINKMEASCSPIVQTSGLPDLNSSVASTTLFYQPFTDIQQVQLRAQIFVYGSLIQGIPPDEACMVSAFGETDGARSSWEGAWHSSVEKHQNQKSPCVNSETKHPRSAVRVHKQVTRCSSLLSKSSDVSTTQSGEKVVPSPLLSSTPLPSPVWSISTHDVRNTNMPRSMQLDFSQASSPLHSYYSSQTRQFEHNSTPWSSQASCNGPRGVSVHGSTLNAITQYSTVPVVETVQVTPVKDSSASRAPNIQLVPPSALLPTSSPLSLTAVSVVKNETQRKTASPVTNKNVASSQKPRKRKKPAELEDLVSTIPVSQPTVESVSAAIAENVPPVSAGLVSCSSMPTKVTFGNLLSTTANVIPAHSKIINNNTTEQRAIFSEETSSRIEQAKLQAEAAAALAAASVRHSQGIWSQLAAQRDSGLLSEVDLKLASAAVAAAAAISVAKAAAAAAKVASDAALQAKMMADETLYLAKTGYLTKIAESGFDTGKNLGRLTPDSILKGKDTTDGSCSVISAAREAARRRVEAASAATKRAENIDAIVKAAELAAEAVSQAGAIIAMGDPLPFRLSELVDAGTEGFWNSQHSSTEKLNTNNLLEAKDNHIHNHDLVVKQSDDRPLNNKDIHKTASECEASNKEQPVTLTGNYQEGGLVNSQNDSHQRAHLSTDQMESDIQQGSFVEVVSDDNGLGGAWFSARVLELKDNKAHVCYDLLNDKGSGQLKEWVSLGGEGKTAPRIRIAHPMTTLKHEATRKRCREDVGNYVWALGDHVDAWMRDGWWEGIVTEKSQGDETKLTLHFPAGGDSSVVRAWDLRPSLTWKDGRWSEWSRSRENTFQPYEGDTPQEKRRKLGSPEAKIDTNLNGRGIEKLSKKIPLEDLRNPEESRPLNLSAKDRIFSVGRIVREQGISDALVKRKGLQKERSRVIFGVPKPGKKRKFMEVSKHYVTDNKTNKASKGNESLKFAKYLMPQQSGLWKYTSKVEPKGKQAGESDKPRGLNL
ncbi:uncharacterized protein M6B38_139605 [Iris pallida]|uniref:Agenet domain-containing protein n=1 Tax=Iris pallida TaxID=29817 RepID=A0AAX6FCS2_IRIPA|nr:uncharacterized protein M6B38_139605 [Iris pallida]